jgi:phosphoglycerate dehydrogenase-like enzyme
VRVLVIDAIAPEGVAYLAERGFQMDQVFRPSAAELQARIADYEAIITRSSTAVTAALLDRASHLRFVGRAISGRPPRPGWDRPRPPIPRRISHAPWPVP